MANLKEIQEFLENIAKTNLHKVEINTDEFDIKVQFNPDVNVVSAAQNIQPVISNPLENNTKEKTEEDVISENNDDLLTVKSPMIGTFYRKPAPDKPAFVEIGQNINSGDVLCIIEAMKLFNEIESEMSGEIVKILVEDGSPVEYDQPLFLLK